MKKRAFITITLSLLAVVLAAPSAVGATAGGSQFCEPGDSCEVGEFLYNDDYTPVTSAACTITSRYPDGSIYLNAQAMSSSGNSDGWWSYSFTAPSTTGMYRTTVCCTVSGTNMCLDKSFEVRNINQHGTGDIASAVWGYSDRTLSSFGTLVSDVWSNSTRSLTNITTGSSNSETIDFSGIESEITQTRQLLEELAGAPVIENITIIDSDLSQKLTDTQSVANQLFANSQLLLSKLSSIETNWYSLSRSEIQGIVQELSDLIGSTGDSSLDTIMGEIAWLSENWGWDITSDMSSFAQSLKSGLVSFYNELDSKGKTVNAKTKVVQLVEQATSLEESIGSATDAANSSSLYGKLGEVGDLSSALDSQLAEIDQLLVDIDNLSPQEISFQTRQISSSVSLLNQLPGVNSIFKYPTSSAIESANKLSALRAVLLANKNYLSSNSSEITTVTWVESNNENMIFKSLMVNPSSMVSRGADLAYFLPSELTKDDILSNSEGLTIIYDVEKDKLKVEGSYTLPTSSSKIVEVKTKDLWALTEDSITTLKTQAAELTDSLKGTSYHAQAVTLKGEIDKDLDDALKNIDLPLTPEARIKAFRQAKLEMFGAEEKLAALQDLVSQATASKALFGFIGGSQAIAVWGLIIVIVAGFAFLTYYMKIMRDKELKKTKKTKGTPKATPPAPKRPRLATQFYTILAISAILSAVASGVLVGALQGSRHKRELASLEESIAQLESATAVLGEQDNNAEPEDEVIETQQEKTKENEEETLGTGGLDIVLLDVPLGSYVNVRQTPSSKGKIVGKIKYSSEFIRLGQKGEWVEIVFEESEAFVHSDFIIEPEELDRAAQHE